MVIFFSKNILYLLKILKIKYIFKNINAFWDKDTIITVERIIQLTAHTYLLVISRVVYRLETTV